MAGKRAVPVLFALVAGCGAVLGTAGTAVAGTGLPSSSYASNPNPYPPRPASDVKKVFNELDDHKKVFNEDDHHAADGDEVIQGGKIIREEHSDDGGGHHAGGYHSGGAESGGGAVGHEAGGHQAGGGAPGGGAPGGEKPGGQKAGNRLPFTGAPVGALAGIGGGLLAAGTAGVLISVRRRRSAGAR
ncbi:hypothetical protein OG589_05590 [Sphaerisporangium sp. NBC_01403]|uniref:hypothetical protein n=1 Tax=Sphaerisporangium sp. NBC_01403 TaxID=2903599 RepID=UPI00325430A2